MLRTAPLHANRGRPARTWRIVHTESSTGWGGQEHRILAELDGFRKRGAEVRLVAPAESEVFRRARAMDLPVQARPMTRLRLIPNVLQLAAWLRTDRIDILNPHSSRDAWLAGLAGRMARVPLIIRTRHFDVPIPNPRLSRYVYAHLADHILTTSPKVTEHLRQLFQLDPARISTVPTGVDLNVFSPEGPRAGWLERQPNGPLIGLIAVIRRAKGHETLLRAAQMLRARGFQARYLFVGEGPNRARVEQVTGELGLGDCVQFAGHREEVADILRGLSVLVIPSLHEGIPQVGLQALATQTPVIGSDTGGIPSIIRPGETGRLFPAGDAAALAEAIRATVEQTEETKRLSGNGRLLVEREHGTEQMLDRLEAVYQQYLPP